MSGSKYKVDNRVELFSYIQQIKCMFIVQNNPHYCQLHLYYSHKNHQHKWHKGQPRFWCTHLCCTNSPLDRKAPQDCATLALSSAGRQVWLCRVAKPTPWWSPLWLQAAADSRHLQNNFHSLGIQVVVRQKCPFDSGDTHLLSRPNLVGSWVGAAWQSHAWRAAPGSLAGRTRTEDRNRCLPRWRSRPYSTLTQHCPQTHTSLFLRTHGQTWGKEKDAEIRKQKSRFGTFCALLALEHLVELKLVCFTSICRRRNAPKSQPGLLLNKWSFWYTGKWLNWRAWGYKLTSGNWDNMSVWI